MGWDWWHPPPSGETPSPLNPWEKPWQGGTEPPSPNTPCEPPPQIPQEIGDVENWARSIELDMRTIATALEYVYKGQLQPSCS